MPIITVNRMKLKWSFFSQESFFGIHRINLDFILSINFEWNAKFKDWNASGTKNIFLRKTCTKLSACFISLIPGLITVQNHQIRTRPAAQFMSFRLSYSWLVMKWGYKLLSISWPIPRPINPGHVKHLSP